MKRLDSVYCRFAVHTDEIQLIEYLPQANVFISFGKTDRCLKIWSLTEVDKHILLEIPLAKTPTSVCPLTLPDHQPTQRFLIFFEQGESEMFEYDGSKQTLTWKQTEKTREHEFPVTSCDFNQRLKVLVTGDSKGNIRLWSEDKLFLREIQFPTSIDSVCFLSSRGDLLVSHANRISLIKVETYWTEVFDWYGIQNPINPGLVAQFTVEPTRMRQIIVESEQVMDNILKNKINSTEAESLSVQQYHRKHHISSRRNRDTNSAAQSSLMQSSRLGSVFKAN